MPEALRGPLRDSLGRALLIGAIGGSLVAAVLTAVNWHLNPGGIFHGPQGTQWQATAETAWSWFWPVTLLLAALALPVLHWRARRRDSSQQSTARPNV